MKSNLHIGLAATIAISASTVLAQPSAPYVAAGRIACLYGLPSDALQKLPPQRLSAVVRVSLDRKGNVDQAVLEQSSGDVVFDALAVRQSRKAACRPFSDVDGVTVPVETNFKFAVAAAEFRPTAASETFPEKVARRVRANIAWNGQISQLQTTVSVHCSQDGKLLSTAITRSSGDPAWDAVALNAVQRSDPIPSDTDGKTPKDFTVTVTPGPA